MNDRRWFHHAAKTEGSLTMRGRVARKETRNSVPSVRSISPNARTRISILPAAKSAAAASPNESFSVTPTSISGRNRWTSLEMTRKTNCHVNATPMSQFVRDGGAHRRHILRHGVHLAGELQRIVHAHA